MEKIRIRLTTILDINGLGLNFFEKIVLADEVLPQIVRDGIIVFDGMDDCRIFIGDDLSPLRKFMENYRHGRLNSNIPLMLTDNALK